MVGLPSEAMGQRTGRLLLERITEEAPEGANGARPDVVRECFPTGLLIGTSCGCTAGVIV